MTMSANPRSPESGEMPEAIAREIAFARALADELATNGMDVRSDGMRRLLPGTFFALSVGEHIDRLTAELSTARERADRAEQAVKRAVEIADDHCARGKEVTHYTASEPIGVRGGCVITKVGDLVDVRDDLERHVRATVDPDWHFNVTRYRDRAKSDA